VLFFSLEEKEGRTMTSISPDVLIGLWLIVAACSGAALFIISRPKR
jgi:hypothetical protein